MKKMLAKKILLLFLCSILLLLTQSISIVASSTDNPVEDGMEDRFPSYSPWLKDSDHSIYENPIDANDEADTSVPKAPGFVEKAIAELFRNIASSLLDIMNNNLNASIDTIIYGRVGSGHPKSVNIYSFELRNGNPYGVTGSVVYSLLRGICYIFMGVSFVFFLAKSAWGGQTSKSREQIKSNIFQMLFCFVAFALMPYLLDVALYFRDVILYGIKNVTSQMITGGATLNISKIFLQRAESSGTFVDAVMYMGTILLTWYFIFIYISIAFDLMVSFVAYLGVKMLSKNQESESQLLKGMLGDIITPIIDAILLLVPLLTSLMLSNVVKGVAIIQLIMCGLIIPTRGKIKGMLGVQNHAERNGILALLGAFGLAKSVGNKVKHGIEQIGDAIRDTKSASMHGELSRAENQEQDDLLSTYQPDAKSNTQPLEEDNASEENFDEWNDSEIVSSLEPFTEDVQEDENFQRDTEPDLFNGEIEPELISNQDAEEDEILPKPEVKPEPKGNENANIQEGLAKVENKPESKGNHDASMEGLPKVEDKPEEKGNQNATYDEGLPKGQETLESNGGMDIDSDEKLPLEEVKPETETRSEQEIPVAESSNEINLNDMESEKNMYERNVQAVKMEGVDKAPESSDSQGEIEETISVHENESSPLNQEDSIPVHEKIPKDSKKNAEQQNSNTMRNSGQVGAARTIGELVSGLEQDINKQDQNIEVCREQKAGLQVKNKELDRKLLEEEPGSKAYEDVKKEKADIGIQIAKLDENMQVSSQEKNRLKNQLDHVNQSMRSSGYGSSSMMDQQRKQAEIVRKHANINNFESPDFKGVLSHADLERLYKQRANKTGAKVIAKTAATVAGAVTFGSAGAFLPSIAPHLMEMGGQFGGFMADKTVDVTSNILTRGTFRESSQLAQPQPNQVSNHSAHSSGNTTAQSVMQPSMNQPAQPVENPQVKTEHKQPAQPVENPEVKTVDKQSALPVENPEVKTEHKQPTQPAEEVNAIQKQAHIELAKAFHKDGKAASSMTLKAIQQANIQAEKYFASCKENHQELSSDEMQKKRIELQTDLLAEQLIKKLKLNGVEEKEVEKTKSVLKEKVKKIIEKKNKGIYS